MENEDYQQSIPPELQKEKPDGTGITLGGFSETVNHETLSIFINRVVDEVKTDEYRRLIIKEAAQTLNMDIEELTRQVDNKRALPEEPAPVDPEPIYFVNEDGYLCTRKTKCIDHEPVDVIVRLANFIANIVEEVSEDDGQQITHKYLLEGRCENNPLPRIDVPAAQFPSMAWVSQWSSGVIIEPGWTIKETVRHAIQVLSKDTTQQTYVFKHTGWREENKNKIFLSHGGAIGGDDIKVQLSKELSRYSLPSHPENEIEAIRTSLSFLDIGKHEVTLPLFTAVYLAPLTSLFSETPHPVNFSFYVYGSTGAFKTTLALIALSHFGDFNATCLSNFEDTENYLEYRSFLLKDTIMVLDDYHPSHNRQDAIKKEQLVQRLIRAFSNRTARGRLNSDSTEKGRYEPRGILIITGEEIAKLQSTIARLFVIEIHQGDVDSAKLSELQAKVNLLPQAMASYIYWVRDHYDRIKEKIPPRFAELRQKATLGSGHRKLSEQVAFLMLTLELVSSWLIEKGVLSKAEGKALISEGEDIFRRLTERHGKRIKDEDPIKTFEDIILSLIRTGKVNLEKIDGQ